MEKGDESNDMISPAKFYRGCTQKGTMILKINNFSRFVNGSRNSVRKSGRITIGGFSWKIIASTKQEDGIQWLTLSLFCYEDEELTKKEWSLVTECNFKVISQLSNIKKVHTLYHTFSHEEPVSTKCYLMQCEKLLDESNGYIQNDTINIESWIITNFPSGFCFQTLDSTKLFKWPIFNFKIAATRSDPKNSLLSNVFLVGKHKFALKFDSTNMVMNESRDYCSLWLLATDLKVDESVEVRYKMWIENMDGKQIVDKIFKGTQTRNFTSQRMRYGNSKFVYRDDLYLPERTFLKDNFLFICCEVSIVQEPKLHEVIQSPIRRVQYKLSSCKQQFSDLCTIQVEDRAFKIEKCLLMMHSHVFKSKLLSSNVNIRECIVQMDNFDSETVQAFINYIKYGKIEVSEELVISLFMLASEYRVEGLKRKCVDYLLRGINKSRVVNLLIFTFRYGVHEFNYVKEHFYCYYLDKFEEAFKSDAWKELMEYQMPLAEEIKSLIVKKN